MNTPISESPARQAQQAAEFLRLHHDPKVLILPNAWDVISARIFEAEGFRAIGTTSAGISATLGYPDGQQMSLDENMRITERIARNLRVPVSADIEAGYSPHVEGVVAAARAAIGAGAVGINLEDGTGDPVRPLVPLSTMVERVAAIRRMSDSTGIHLVLNLRTDAILTSLTLTEDVVEEAVRRGNAFAEAGADCVFVPDTGTMDNETIVRLVRDIDVPLNILLSAKSPGIAELEDIGVARVSFGPRMMRVALALIRNIAREVRDRGTTELLAQDSMSYQEVNQLLSDSRNRFA